ncbi:GNAT family N-acetyltransferase [Dyadobacter fermentans]|uniref:GCN5-related N-acetyltransferase n=1 Tax=Dyadobacter fermentans (strain ATCC 700827 / DSM 18053 / CIP 107007 / KCTC 52180 / NS114) TaxID=471854 RepID=C6VZN0_DYAFD|nr:GNAT family N-acetyltransferase [Dyadobacter fermentans]ACT93508.1 GCN5-related N-acetyltransferase [Dyadobacter fermentans DSM 18053]
MAINIIPLQKDSYQDIIQVWEASVRATHSFLSEADIQFYKPLILNQYLDQLSLFGILDHANKLAGFIGIEGVKIQMLFVHPDNFQQGVGRALCMYSVEELGICQVDVNEDNPGACLFYSKLGFKIAGRSPLDESGKPFPILHLAI